MYSGFGPDHSFDPSSLGQDSVLTDVRMPGSMNGFGLAKWIGSNKPQISVILASGEIAQSEAAKGHVYRPRFDCLGQDSLNFCHALLSSSARSTTVTGV
jgi:CheY-like chemotaxis protein